MIKIEIDNATVRELQGTSAKTNKPYHCGFKRITDCP